MQQSLIVVFTRNPGLTSELAARLADRARLVAGETLAEMQELLKTHRPAVVVIDLTGQPMREEADFGWIEQIHNDHPEAFLYQIGGDSASLRKWKSRKSDGVQILPAEISTEELVNRLSPHFRQANQANEEPPRNEAAGKRSQTLATKGKPKGDSREWGAETVLTGITRRFETNSPEMKAMLQDLEVAARHNVTILLIGETGSGKTFLSKLIHEVSPRRNEPFLHVACGALPNELIESELFGHVKGAFTSAHADKQGKFVAAGSGTILLDEIDVLGPEQQVKLLKVIETGEFEPVGSNQTHVSQARLVVASNLDLQPLVEEGQFRPDLYYRLNMLKFELLPLRSRKADVIPLAKKFIRQLAAKHEIPIARIESHFFEALCAYPWPGNVRELENVIQRAVIYSQLGVLGAAQLPSHILAGTAEIPNDPANPLQSDPKDADTLGRQIALTEKEIIEQALFKNSFSRTRTAKDLGISRVTLYNKMKKYDMMKK